MSQRPLVGIGVIVYDGDRVLLMKRQNSHGDGTWSPPGGHLEYSESPQQCAMREVAEEVGVTIAEPTFYTITNDIFEREGKHYVTLWMRGRYVSGEPHIHSAREMSQVGWFSVHDLPTPRFLPLDNLLAQGYSLIEEQ